MLKKLIVVLFPVILLAESLLYKNGEVVFAAKHHMIKSGIDTFLQCYMSGNWGKCSNDIISYNDTVLIYPNCKFHSHVSTCFTFMFPLVSQTCFHPFHSKFPLGSRV